MGYHALSCRVPGRRLRVRLEYSRSTLCGEHHRALHAALPVSTPRVPQEYHRYTPGRRRSLVRRRMQGGVRHGVRPPLAARGAHGVLEGTLMILERDYRGTVRVLKVHSRGAVRRPSAAIRSIEILECVGYSRSLLRVLYGNSRVLYGTLRLL